MSLHFGWSFGFRILGSRHAVNPIYINCSLTFLTEKPRARKPTPKGQVPKCAHIQHVISYRIRLLYISFPKGPNSKAWGVGRGSFCGPRPEQRCVWIPRPKALGAWGLRCSVLVFTVSEEFLHVAEPVNPKPCEA